jgi:hypothetical protein
MEKDMSVIAQRTGLPGPAAGAPASTTFAAGASASTAVAGAPASTAVAVRPAEAPLGGWGDIWWP